MFQNKTENMRPKFLLFVLALIIIFSSCNKTPEHAKYIPKNALAVVGLNTKALSKKIAWNALMGSELLDEMKAALPADKAHAAEDLSNAGIDVLSTVYFYFNPTVSDNDYKYITAVVPLSDAKQWENYLQENFKNVTIQQNKDRKEALLEEEVYAAWNTKVAIVRKVIIQPSENFKITYSSDDSIPANYQAETTVKPDIKKLAGDMQTAFTPQKGNEITDDKRFIKLQEEGDDINFWMNYEVLMSRYGAMGGGITSGLALGNNLWKDAALAAGLNFDKGKITSDAKYYLSNELNEMYAKFGSKNPDKDMLNRLPMQNASVVFAANISTDGIKATIEKMGVLGLVNIALAQSGMSADDIFKAFTGDMAFSLTDFNTETTTDYNIHQTQQDTVIYKHRNTTFHCLFALKINDQQKVEKMLNYLKSQNGLQEIAANTFQLAFSDSVFVLKDAKYLVIVNHLENGRTYLKKGFTTQAQPDLLKDLAAHPSTFYVDFQTVFNGVHLTAASNDEKRLALAKATFDNLLLKGGKHKKEFFSYSGVMNLINKDENSLLQLLNFGYKMQHITDSVATKTADSPMAKNQDTVIRN